MKNRFWYALLELALCITGAGMPADLPTLGLARIEWHNNPLYGKRLDGLSSVPKIIFARALKAVADDGCNPVALEELGHYYFKGYGTEINLEEACKCFVDGLRYYDLSGSRYNPLVRMYLLYGLGRVLRIQGLALQTSRRTRKQGKQILSAAFDCIKTVVFECDGAIDAGIALAHLYIEAGKISTDRHAAATLVARMQKYYLDLGIKYEDIPSIVNRLDADIEFSRTCIGSVCGIQ
jgi:hypothetical protein